MPLCNLSRCYRSLSSDYRMRKRCMLLIIADKMDVLTEQNRLSKRDRVTYVIYIKIFLCSSKVRCLCIIIASN